jgi:YD repeat-containing protein
MGKANTTTFQYDRNNRLVKETRPLGEQSSYEYDQVGNLARKVKIGDVRDLLTFLSATDTLSLWLAKHA